MTARTEPWTWRRQQSQHESHPGGIGAWVEDAEGAVQAFFSIAAGGADNETV